jgi:hypothetical protein
VRQLTQTAVTSAGYTDRSTWVGRKLLLSIKPTCVLAAGRLLQQACGQTPAHQQHPQRQAVKSHVVCMRELLDSLMQVRAAACPLTDRTCTREQVPSCTSHSAASTTRNSPPPRHARTPAGTAACLAATGCGHTRRVYASSASQPKGSPCRQHCCCLHLQRMRSKHSMPLYQRAATPAVTSYVPVLLVVLTAGRQAG